MNQHPYLRAYMAGITVPTIFLLIIVTVFTIARSFFEVPLIVERAVIFPMAIVPNAWGLWNVLYVAKLSRRGTNMGAFGGMLACLVFPVGLLVTQLLGYPPDSILAVGVPIGFPVAFFVYYLVWKYIVSLLNRVVGVA